MKRSARRRLDEVPEDDGMVLIDGVLRTPEWVHMACAQTFTGWDGKGGILSKMTMQGSQRRYVRCYFRPDPYTIVLADNTTPSFKQFRRGVQ